MNKYQSLSLAKIQHLISQKTNLIHGYQMIEATEEKDLSTKIQAEEAELDLLLEALEQKEQKPSISSGTANQSYERSLKIMELNNASYKIRLPLRTVEVTCHTKPEARKRHSRSNLYSHNASSNFQDSAIKRYNISKSLEFEI